MTANASESARVVLAAALDYIARGWSPIPVPFRTKGPLIDAWQTIRINAETAPSFFNGGPQNIGIILGAASGGLCDFDLDCSESIAAAPYILPRTAVFGRATKPASHWVYRTNLHETKDRAAIKFMGSDKTGLLEVRMGAGGLASQTVFPPSTHASGEPIEWAGGGASEIAEVDGDELIQRARRLAAASELARSYPKIGGRHDAAFVLGSFLTRCGFSPPVAATFVEAVAAASLQPGDKRRDMARTARDGAAAGKLAGFPLLAETFGEGAAKKVADWLDYGGEREGRGVRAEATTAESASWGDAEREIVVRLAEGDSAGFLARAKADAGFPFEPEAMAALNQLAKRRAPDFERLRTQLKAETKVRFAALEALMKAETAIGDSGEDGLPGRPITFEEIQPWREPIDGDALLTELSETIGAYVIMEPGQRDACALWAVHAHAHDLRDISPPLVVKAPAMRSGKTKLLETLERLVPRPLLVSGITAAFLERAIEAHRPTLLIDEYDALTSNDPALAEAARAQLNRSARRRGARVGKNVPLPGGGYESRLFSTWAPTVIAGIGKPPATIMDRAVPVDLKRKLSNEPVRPLRDRDGADLVVLARKIARFVDDNAEMLREIEPTPPLAVNNDRAKDMWEPLLAIADTAGSGWPRRAREAALGLCRTAEDEAADEDVRITLLTDIRDIFARLPPRDDAVHGAQGGRPADGPRLLTRQLLDELIGLEERPWSTWGKSRKPLTDTGLAGLLRPYWIRSNTVRGEGSDRNVVGKGYLLRSFEDAFSRYLPIPGVSTRYTVTNPGNARGSEDFAAVTNSVCNGLENAGNVSNSGVRNGVTGRNRGERGSAEIEGPDGAEQDTSSEWDFDL
jgi:Protein of unknown function (DUF3631)/Bifunctional DNA primase/polymerase, N-terminal